MRIVHGCCVGDWGKFQSNVVPRLAGPVLALGGQTSIAYAYNTILDAAKSVGPDILILQHDDLEITDPDWVAKIEAVFSEDNVGIVGIAGARNITGLAWWNDETVGHQMTDGLGMLDFGVRSGDVEALEGSFLAVGPWFLENLRFDERYPGFHGYDSIVAEVFAAGKRVIVADVDTHHHTAGGFSSPESEAEWHRCSEIYNQRWRFGQ